MGALRPSTARPLGPARLASVFPWGLERRGRARRAGAADSNCWARLEQAVLAEGGPHGVHVPVRSGSLLWCAATDGRRRLFLEYARVMSLDREALSYTDWEHDEYW